MFNWSSAGFANGVVEINAIPSREIYIWVPIPEGRYIFGFQFDRRYVAIKKI